MRRDALSIVVPTLGARTLVQMLGSCLLAGLHEDDEIVLVVDTHGEHGAETATRVEIVAESFASHVKESRGFPLSVVIGTLDAGRHVHGNPQRNRAIELATRPWIVGQDEDDIFTLRAFDAIRRAIDRVLDDATGPAGFGAGLTPRRDNRPRPLMFRFECLIRPPGARPFRQILPEHETITEGQIDGHSMVYPNDKLLLGTWTDRYESDYDFMTATVQNYRATGLDPVWSTEVIGIARPHQAPYASRSAL